LGTGDEGEAVNRMNREMKRMMQKGKQAKPAAAPRRAATPGAPKKPRTKPSEFIREVRAELKKVNWPSRREVGAYTAVVLVSVVAITVYIFGLDTMFGKLVLLVFGKGA